MAQAWQSRRRSYNTFRSCHGSISHRRCAKDWITISEGVMEHMRMIPWIRLSWSLQTSLMMMKKLFLEYHPVHFSYVYANSNRCCEVRMHHHRTKMWRTRWINPSSRIWGIASSNVGTTVTAISNWTYGPGVAPRLGRLPSVWGPLYLLFPQDEAWACTSPSSSYRPFTLPQESSWRPTAVLRRVSKSGV